MAIFKDRVPENVQGRYYVDYSCTDCDVCRMVAPANFARVDEQGVSYVKKQPESEDEEMLCQEAMAACPHESIADDGEKYEWSAIPPYDVAAAEESHQEFLKSLAEENKKKGRSWWKFWQ